MQDSAHTPDFLLEVGLHGLFCCVRLDHSVFSHKIDYFT